VRKMGSEWKLKAEREKFTAKTRRTQRCFFLFFAVDPPKITADRKDGKE
jgi:hypothetical protein